MKIGLCSLEINMPFSGSILRYLAKSYIELMRFSCSLSPALACIWNSRPGNNCNTFSKIRIFSPEVLWTPKQIWQERSTKGTYRMATKTLATFAHL